MPRTAELVLVVSPRSCRINGRSTLRTKPRPTIVKSHEYAGAMLKIEQQVAAWMHRTGAEPFEQGAIAMSVVFFVAKTRRLDTPTPYLDADSPLKCLLDGMQKGGLIDDDVRIAELHVRKGFASSDARERFAVRIWECDPIEK